MAKLDVFVVAVKVVGKKINFKIYNKYEIKTLLLFTFVSLFIIMFSCSEETFEETDEETYTNVAIQTDPSYPQSMTTNTSSNIKPITNPNPKVPVSGSDKYKSPNNETNKAVEEIPFGKLFKPKFIDSEISIHSLNMIVPENWNISIKEDQGEIKIQGGQGDIWIKNYAYKDGMAHRNAFYSEVEGILNGAKEKNYIEKSNLRTFFNGSESVISTGNYGRPFRQHLFIASSATHLTMFVFSCNPDYLSEYEDIFKEVIDSIEIIKVLNKTPTVETVTDPGVTVSTTTSTFKSNVLAPTRSRSVIKITPTATVVATPIETTKSSGFMGYENGITWGSTTVYNGIGYFYVDDLKQYYTNANDQLGYFYSGYAEPTAFYGNIKRNPSLCGDHDGYSGFSFNNEPTLASLVENYNNSDIKYEDLNVTFGTARSECYSGLLPFTQGGRYGLIDPVSMEGNGDLLLNWWIADRGVKEFFAAPSMRGGANLTKNWDGTKKLHVGGTENNDGTGFGGVYNYVSNFNGRPMWVNLECGDGSEKCYIFYYKDPNGAVDKYGTLIDRGTWVVQTPEPSGKWSAASYTDAEWPWQGGWGEPIVFVLELEGE